MTTTAPNTGGAAPEDRQCRYALACGRHCRRWAMRGHEFCHEHARWMDTRIEGPVELPLLEDPASITLVLSQTARALAWGQIPAVNGRAVIAACRVVQAGFALALSEAKFRFRLSQAHASERDFLPYSLTSPQPHQPVTSNQPPVTCNHQAVTCNPQPVTSNPAPVASNPQPVTSPPPANPLDDLPHKSRPISVCDPCVAALAQGADPASIDCQKCPACRAGNLQPPPVADFANPPSAARLDAAPSGPAATDPAFRGLRNNWDLALQRAESSLADMRAKRPDETHEDFLAARARPFDALLQTPPPSPPPPIPAIAIANQPPAP